MCSNENCGVIGPVGDRSAEKWNELMTAQKQGQDQRQGPPLLIRPSGGDMVALEGMPINDPLRALQMQLVRLFEDDFSNAAIENMSSTVMFIFDKLPADYAPGRNNRDFWVQITRAQHTNLKPYFEAIRRHALHDAVTACVVTEQEFLSPEYATPQPVGSITERFACKRVEKNIRKLIDETYDPQEGSPLS